jgi:hypothetical protein
MFIDTPRPMAGSNRRPYMMGKGGGGFNRDDQHRKAEDITDPGARVRAAARRALAEAAERRKAAGRGRPAAESGRDGPEPVRCGDWEVKGIASDF